MTTQRKERGRIRLEGMGGFLNPPGHPEHTSSVETDLRRRPENRGGMSLSSAIGTEWLDDAIRAECRRKLAEWDANKLPLTDPAVQDWIRQVLGYFRGCYRNTAAPRDEQWHASELVIDQTRKPLDWQNDHAGVNLIRKYYPDYVPTAEDFAQAYWGTKPNA